LTLRGYRGTKPLDQSATAMRASAAIIAKNANGIAAGCAWFFLFAVASKCRRHRNRCLQRDQRAE